MLRLQRQNNCVRDELNREIGRPSRRTGRAMERVFFLLTGSTLLPEIAFLTVWSRLAQPRLPDTIEPDAVHYARQTSK